MRIYLAAPFFNKEEIEAIEKIENVLENSTHKYFSPRKQHNGKPQLEKPGVRDQIFRRNYDEIAACDMVVAWVDRLLPEGKSVWVVDFSEPQVPDPVKGPLYQPDIGTVWEMGCAFGLEIPTLMFTLFQPDERRMNLMLTEAVLGVCYGLENLSKLLALPSQEWRIMLSGWKGGFE